MPMLQTVGASREAWSVGFLLDVILTRDLWMHRVDAASGLGLDLDAQHDGVLVGDVVTKWAGRHRQPSAVQLSVAGRWALGIRVGGSRGVRGRAGLSAVDLSGRGAAALRTHVPF